jgi:predicted transcriptional regulator YdeE
MYLLTIIDRIMPNIYGVAMMKKTIAQLPEIKLVGITARTNNASEMNPTTSKIGLTAQTYFHGGLAEKIAHRKNPGTTYCIYTNYESDFTGDYTYFIGEEVTSFKDAGSEFETLSIPSQNYAKFTNGPEKMPDVCISAWQQIWAMSPSDLGEVRNYIADFEVYDERSRDLQNVTLDIYIGIRN